MKNIFYFTVASTLLAASQSEETIQSIFKNRTGENTALSGIPEFSRKLFEIGNRENSQNTSKPVKVNGANVVKVVTEKSISRGFLEFHVSPPKDDYFITAELHIYKKSPRPQNLKITIYRVYDKASDFRHKIDEANIGENFTGWQIFNVTNALEFPFTSSQNVTLDVHTVEEESLSTVPAEFVRSNDTDMLQKVPIFVLFFNNAENCTHTTSEFIYETGD